MLKIEDLKFGDVVVNKETGTESIVLGISLKFSYLYVGDGSFIFSGNFKCFKKKEEHTFNDLIDVAVQANNDRVINGFTVVGEKLNCQTLDGEEYNLGIGCEVSHGIEYLQSLYKETFVIESEEDIKRIKLKSEVTLSNNNKFIVDNVSDTFITPNNLFDKLTILSLKGATVEQPK